MFRTLQLEVPRNRKCEVEEIAVARAGLERVAAQLADPELRRLFEGSDPWRESRAEDSP